MPIETDHPAPWGRERYRFHPWYERPLTEGQLLACLAACSSVVATILVACGATVWMAGWPVRWLVEPIVVLALLVLAAAGRDAWSDLTAEAHEEP